MFVKYFFPHWAYEHQWNILNKIKFSPVDYASQIVDPQYGMFTWPAAPVLAQFIWHNREQVKGKQIIEVCANDTFFSLLRILPRRSSHSKNKTNKHTHKKGTFSSQEL